ncbi:MAG: integron integrase [Lentisphaeria bacterium]|nr:integron integrase [Lentisphaeria bacterium]
MSGPQKSRLLDEVREVLRRRHYSSHTERAYCSWIRRYVRFHEMSRRSDLANGSRKIEVFLTHLSVDREVAPSTQNQATNALAFLYKNVLDLPLEGRIDAVRASKEPKIPLVLTREEVAQVIALMQGTPQRIVKLLYGSGLRIMEAVRLRVHDMDFEKGELTVWSERRDRDRVTTLPRVLEAPFREHLVHVRALHNQDLATGCGAVHIPGTLAGKHPAAATEWGWQYVFPTRNLSVDPRSDQKHRRHVDRSVVNKAIQSAARCAGMTKRVSAHTFRHSFAAHLFQRGTDIRTIQALLGHKDVSTTMIYTHIPQPEGSSVVSPLDDLEL